MKDIIFLVGPTAVGKTETSIHLAKKINAEIISCDSMQVYKGMDIGTQKPTPAQLKKVPHHIVDIINPARNFSVALYRKKAIDEIKKIHRKKKVPLFVGGTALYMKAMVDGLFPAPSADRALRKRLLRQEECKGKGFLYKRLLKVDKQTAKLLHPNDTRRIIRALEVYIQTKKPMHELKKRTKGLKDLYNIKIFCLSCAREKLYEKINRRVDMMFKKGLVAECRRLKQRRLSMTAKQALGYKEVFDFLDKKTVLKDAKELIKQRTRNFAKRQLSWFRNDKRIIWIDSNNGPSKEIAERLYKLCMK
ncbi:MAG: tRNA (adenosine(37)-N6)-dimethylallyltransferase MiaA [Candidatus Omnitrophica bacterium]|nr:tRNA (adenosine(37)-N6)-dimethylallyltransferase MiaA [Candidatus Omnitrophota bacterium]